MSAGIRASRVTVLGLYLLSQAAFAKTLPLPDNLISLTSEQGEHLLLDSEARQAYWPLSIQFVTQKNRAYCGVASIVMVLHKTALGSLVGCECCGHPVPPGLGRASVAV